MIEGMAMVVTRENGVGGGERGAYELFVLDENPTSLLKIWQTSHMNECLGRMPPQPNFLPGLNDASPE